ncbi:MAG TPA: hypothetical protein VFP35_01850 [Candidatus Saccharimonadales bacterium]|nr:hypothetical protein [Candidatus Saccharimonadales bacterium]
MGSGSCSWGRRPPEPPNQAGIRAPGSGSHSGLLRAQDAGGHAGCQCRALGQPALAEPGDPHLLGDPEDSQAGKKPPETAIAGSLGSVALDRERRDPVLFKTDN